ncbi:MAG: diaminopropionate ammonia-lyase [Methylobacteriaceae bacterium]|nr:diaminopropionate ammonia-lyase [Methylobacteriaceae bacterium]
MTADLPRHPVRHVRNAYVDRARPPGAAERAIMDLAAFERAHREIASWPGYAPTPLVALPGLARRLGLGAVMVKDEGRRFHLESFTALGGAYAVKRLIEERLAASASAADLRDGRWRAATQNLVFATATDGNHGRSVAWGARMFGARSVVFIHENVSAEREAAIAAFGAEMRRVPGDYDNSVRIAAEEAAKNGWIIVADSSVGIDAHAPSLVMQGYGVTMAEIDAVEPAPTHVFVPAGVGGLAAAVAAHLWEAKGAESPRLVVVEPIRADCVFRSIAAGEIAAPLAESDTFMACLAAGEVSPAAWPFLRAAVDDVLALPDAAAADAMRLLAAGRDGDPPIVAGESGAATTAALVAASQDADVRAALGLGPASRVVLFSTEGATDPAVWRETVGRAPPPVQAP